MLDSCLRGGTCRRRGGVGADYGRRAAGECGHADAGAYGDGEHGAELEPDGGRGGERAREHGNRGACAGFERDGTDSARAGDDQRVRELRGSGVCGRERADQYRGAGKRDGGDCTGEHGADLCDAGNGAGNDGECGDDGAKSESRVGAVGESQAVEEREGGMKFVTVM